MAIGCLVLEVFIGVNHLIVIEISAYTISIDGREIGVGITKCSALVARRVVTKHICLKHDLALFIFLLLFWITSEVDSASILSFQDAAKTFCFVV